MALDRNDALIMEEAFTKALSRSGRGPIIGGGGGGYGGGGGSSSDKGFDLSGVKEKLKDGASDFLEAAGKSADTWQALTKHGANFSNDLIGMNVSAAQSRLSLNDFANVIASNGKNMAGLGGSVTRGAEAFGKLSKSFFDSNAADELQQMGYTAKDLNEVLALQASTSRYTMSADDEGRKRSNKAASDLAKEMDAIAKLTGKSKEEQMESAKKRATDGQIEAKLRLIGIEQGAEAEKAAREGFQKQMAAAEARGMGQMAKEMFATGTVTSEEAATQYALLGEAAQKTGEQMGHLAKGNLVAAEAANKEAEAANAKNQRDPTLLRMAAMGDAAGSVGTILKKSTEDNMALHDSVMGLVKGNSNLLKSQDDYAKALAAIRTDIVKSQEGINKEGKQVSGATQAVVGTRIAGQNFGAGVAGAIVAEDAQGNSVAGGIRRGGEIATAAANKAAGPGRNLAVNMEAGANQAQNPTTTAGPPGEGRYAKEAREDAAKGGTVGAVTGEITKALSSVVTIGTKTLDVTGAVIGLKGYATGGYVSEPTLATIAEEGPEFVLNQGQMKDTITSAGMAGVKNILGKLPPPELDTKEDKFKTIYESMKGMAPPRGDPTGGMNGFDLSSISKAISMPAKTEPNINMAEMSKTISTSISSMTSGESTTKRVQTDDSKSAEKEMSELKSKFNEDMAARKNILIEGMSVEDRKFSKVQAVMKADDEAIKLKEEFSKKQEELQKKIADGITYETTKKQEAVEETKKLITEELAVTLQGQEARLAVIEEEEALKLIGIEQGAEAEAAAREKYQKDSSLLNMAAIGGEVPKASMGAGQSLSATPATPAIDLNAVNLPGFGAQMKANAASVPAAVNKPAAEAKAQADAKEQAGQTTAAAKDKEESKPAQRGGKTAALEDVVKGLDMLNITMNKLLSQSDELGRKQITALEKNPKNMYS